MSSATSQLILQPFCRFIYITAHTPTLPLLHLHQSSFSNLSITSPTSQLIFQPFHHFTYITAHSPTLLSLYLHHSSYSNPSIASLTSKLILQPTGVAKGGVLGVQTPPEISKILPCAHSWVLRGIFCL